MNKNRGTVRKGAPPAPNNNATLLGQILFETRNQLQASLVDALVAKTMLAAVLKTVGEVSISPETIAELQGQAFTIEKSVAPDGGLLVRATIETEEVVEAEEVLDAENEGMIP